MSFVPLVLVVVLFWTGVFCVTLIALGSSASDLLWGRKAPLPEDLGQWIEAGVDGSGRVRQERRLRPGDAADPSFLILQVRWVDARTGEILEVLPEQRERRRRGPRAR
ncbi:MAG TPA: hypothetical protein VN764_02245 [Polyangiaceae bacterium]|nr:hypothetical protein [Polyangiaceae bacterium]